MLSKRGTAASIATIWLAVWSTAPFAAVHVLTHHHELHHEDSAAAGQRAGFDHSRGHNHGEEHSHPTLRLTAGTSPRPPVVRDAIALELPVAFIVVDVVPRTRSIAWRHHERPPGAHPLVLTTVLRI